MKDGMQLVTNERVKTGSYNHAKGADLSTTGEQPFDWIH